MSNNQKTRKVKVFSVYVALWECPLTGLCLFSILCNFKAGFFIFANGRMTDGQTDMLRCIPNMILVKNIHIYFMGFLKLTSFFHFLTDTICPSTDLANFQYQPPCQNFQYFCQIYFCSQESVQNRYKTVAVHAKIDSTTKQI